LNVDPRASQGFSLIELMVVLVVFGLLLSIGIPAYHEMSQDQQLHATAETVGREVQLARMRAMSTGNTQTINFDTLSTRHSVFIVDAQKSTKWTLPRGIKFASGGAPSFTLTNDGRASSSQYLVLKNLQARFDTVSVESSGLVLAR
jgi:prepilin-type N-terminal cleavage/methylation domain-containing protein